MKIAIYGAGAIGGLIGARLAASGAASVSAVARGATLAALRSEGWRLRHDGAELRADVRASDRPAELGPQDLVVVAVKGPALASVAESVAPLIGPATVVLPAINGVPWWFGQGIDALSGAPLRSIDPQGAILAAMPLAHIVGCVVHASAASTTPGVVEHRIGRELIIGEPSGQHSARLREVQAVLTAAGFDVRVSERIRQDIWYKLWGNLTMNPVSALTGATADQVLDDPLVRAFCSAAMREAAQVGERIGCPIAQTPEDRHAVTRKLGAFKTSMLQDVEAGRPIELDAIVAAVAEIAGRLGLATPNIDALLGLTRLFARRRGLYPEAS
ncbi:MAG: 2-dehydropantoate 2-reductase [Burkholderiaceae bacterium]